MAQTPFRQPGKDLEVTDGNVITGADDSQGGDLTLEGGTSSSGNNDAGDVVIRPGLPNGSGARGIVNVTNNGGADTDPILQLTSETGANVEDSRFFVGTRDPHTNVTGNPGDVYITHNGTSSTVSVNTGAGDANTTWTDLAGGGTGGADPGIEGVLWEDIQFYLDAGDRNSYPGSGSTITDLIASKSCTLYFVTITDSHINFNGVSSYLDTGTLSAALVNLFETGGTVAAWVRAESDGGGNAGRVVSTTGSADTKGWYLDVNDESSGLVRFRFEQNRGTTDTVYTTFRTVPINEWAHVVITYDGSDPATKFPIAYINGELVSWDSETAGSGAITSDSGEILFIGNRWGAARTWDGDIDLFQLWDRVLSADEVRQLYRVTGEDRFRPSLLGDAASTSTGDAPDVEIKAGPGGSTSGAGGGIALTAGTTTAGSGGGITITAQDGTSGAGDVILNSGTTSSSGDGGIISLRPGVGAGTNDGYVDIDPDWTGDADPLLQFTVTGSNVDNNTQIFTGNRNPDGFVTGECGSLYLRGNTGSSTLYVNTSGASPGSTWTEIGAGGSGASAGIEGVIWGNNQFYLDAGDRNSYAGSGNTWTDIVGSRAATMTNQTITDGHIIWNASTTTATFTSDSSIEDIWNGGGTLIAWVRADSFGESSVGRIASTANAGNTIGWYAGVTSASGNTWKLYFRQNFDNTDGEWRTTSTVNLNEWLFFAITYDSSSASNEPTLYINTVLDTTDEITNPIGDYGSESGADLDIGRAGDGSGTWGGAIEIVMLYDTELSDDAIRQIYSVTGQDRLRPSLMGAPTTDASRPPQPIQIIAADGGATASDGGAVEISSGASTTGAGGAVSVTGGASEGGTTGGDISITGGDVASTNYSAGDVTIKGGDLDYSSAISPNTGGDVTLESGSYSGTGSAQPGGITIKTGTGGTNSAAAPDLLLQVTSYAGSSALGDIILQGGDNTGTGAAGGIQILAGDASGDPGGGVTITAGDGTGVGAVGGALNLTSGGASASYTGTINIDVPAQSASGRGTGDINITIGDTASNYGSNPSGDISLTAGDHTGTTGTAQASSIFLTAGDHAGNENNAPPGDITLSAGDQTGSGRGAAGGIYIWAGDKTGGSHSTTAGGQVDIDAGEGSGVGPGGAVSITGGLAGSTGTGGGVDIDAGGSGTGATGTGGTVAIDGGTCNATNGAGGPVTITSGAGAGTGNAGALALSGNDGGATSGTGGDASLGGGEGGGTGRGGNLSLFSGTGGANGAGGTVSINAGSGGASAGASGTITISGGDGGSATVAGGAVTFEGGAGNTTGAGGLATVQGGTAGASGNGGSVAITAQDGATNGDGGSVTATAGGGAGTGADGNVSAFADDDGSFQHRTQTTGFAGTQCDHKTLALQASTSGTTVLAVLGVLSTDGLNMKFDVKCTGVRDSNDSDIISIFAVQTAYRVGGTVFLLTAHVDPTSAPGKQTNGTIPWTNIQLAINGDNIELQATATAATGDWNFSIEWTRQLGGYSS